MYRGRKCGIDALRDISPLDHIKMSPFALGLGQVLLQSRDDINFARFQTMYLRLISDFVFDGANLRSTVFLYHFCVDTCDADEGRLGFGFWTFLPRCEPWDFLKDCADGFLGVMALLQPGENLVDVPYRLVSQQDSAHLMDMLWEWRFADGQPETDLRNSCREVLARSAFSGIGFKDLMKDTGHFDELAAREIMKEYEEGMVAKPTACIIQSLVVAADRPQIPDFF